MTVVYRYDGSVIENEEAYNIAMQTKGFDDALAIKYSAYFAKKTKVKKTGRTAYKDSTKTKVYRAEWAFEKKFPHVLDKMTEKEVKNFFKRVVNSKTYQNLSNGRVPSLSFMRDMGGYSRIAGRAGYGEVTLSPATGMNKYVILHELAHTCGNMHHDIKFRVDLVKLVSRFLGVECAKGLKKEFKEKKLKMTVPTTIMSPLKWLESYNKMMKVRKAL